MAPPVSRRLQGRVVVQLRMSEHDTQGTTRKRADSIAQAIGAHVVRTSHSGRVILFVSGADGVQTMVNQLQNLADVEYAHLDSIDKAQS